jgi:hypothetical protein
VNGLQDPTKPDILIVYGDGNFPSGRKFERYVPVKGLKQSIIKRHKNSAEASEFKSSSVCPDSVLIVMHSFSLLPNGLMDGTMKSADSSGAVVMHANLKVSSIVIALEQSISIVVTWALPHQSWKGIVVCLGLIQVSHKTTKCFILLAKGHLPFCDDVLDVSR